MKNALLALLLSTALLLGADLTGKWQFQVDTDAGTGSPTFVLKQEGEKLSGSYSGALGDASVAGSVKGSSVTITFEASGATVIYEGTVDDSGNLKGTVDIGGQAKGTFTGSRTK